MEAIRRFVKVKNHQVNITLPEDFNAEEVEVMLALLPASLGAPRLQTISFHRLAQAEIMPDIMAA